MGKWLAYYPVDITSYVLKAVYKEAYMTHEVHVIQFTCEFQEPVGRTFKQFGSTEDLCLIYISYN